MFCRPCSHCAVALGLLVRQWRSADDGSESSSSSVHKTCPVRALCLLFSGALPDCLAPRTGEDLPLECDSGLLLTWLRRIAPWLCCSPCAFRLQLCRVKSHFVVPSATFLTGARKAVATASYREHVARIPCKVGLTPPARSPVWRVLVHCGRAAGATQALTFFVFVCASGPVAPLVCATPHRARICSVAACASSLDGGCSTIRPTGCARLACTAFTCTTGRRRSRRGAAPAGAVAPAAAAVVAGALGVAVVGAVLRAARPAWTPTSLVTSYPSTSGTIRPRKTTSTTPCRLSWTRSSMNCSTFLPRGVGCTADTLTSGWATGWYPVVGRRVDLLHLVNNSMWCLQEGPFAESAMPFYPRRGPRQMALSSTACGRCARPQRRTTHARGAANVADAVEAGHTENSIDTPGY